MTYYRDMHIGEMIQQGDEVYVNGRWYNTASAGKSVPAGLPYRRAALTADAPTQPTRAALLITLGIQRKVIPLKPGQSEEDVRWLQPYLTDGWYLSEFIDVEHQDG